QMLDSPSITFFNAFHDSHDWPSVNLPNVPTLFRYPVIQQFITASDVKYQKHIAPVVFTTLPRRLIRVQGTAVYRTILTGTPHEITIAYIGTAGSLIEVYIATESDMRVRERWIIERIQPDDYTTIDSYELDCMGTSPTLNERLYLCHLFGKN